MNTGLANAKPPSTVPYIITYKWQLDSAPVLRTFAANSSRNGRVDWREGRARHDPSMTTEMLELLRTLSPMSVDITSMAQYTKLSERGPGALAGRGGAGRVRDSRTDRSTPRIHTQSIPRIHTVRDCVRDCVSHTTFCPCYPTSKWSHSSRLRSPWRR